MKHHSKDHYVTPLSDTGYIRTMPLSHYLGVSHKTLRKWIVEGEIPASKVINVLQLFHNVEMEQWLEKANVDTCNDITGGA